MTSTQVARLAAAAILMGALVTPAAAADKDFEIGLLGGIVYLDESLAGPSGPTIGPTIGIRGGGPLPIGPFDWFADVLYADIDTETFRLGAQSIAARGGLEWSRPGMLVNPWFIDVGLGHQSISFDQATDYSSMFLSAGIGQRYWLGGRRYLRWELRADHSLADAGLMGQDINQPQLLASFNWTLGGRTHAMDSDGDGVDDRRDRCPGTPAGEEVSRKGCPIRAVPQPAQQPAAQPIQEEPQPDADSDGVSDADDLCPSTLLGIEVDAAGCPLDEDGDGVYDGLGMDRCLGTPRGAVVDSHGCPLDSDGDGVFDGLDRCPDSAPGAVVDADGC